MRSLLNLLRYSYGAFLRGIGVRVADVAEQIRDLNVTRDVLMLDMYAKLAESEGMELREFLLKYKIATVKVKKNG